MNLVMHRFGDVKRFTPHWPTQSADEMLPLYVSANHSYVTIAHYYVADTLKAMQLYFVKHISYTRATQSALQSNTI